MSDGRMGVIKNEANQAGSVASLLKADAFIAA
jgi:hypothetical protein